MAKRNRKPRTPEERRDAALYHRLRYLPGQIIATRRKLAALEVEARRLGMTDLLDEAPDDPKAP